MNHIPEGIKNEVQPFIINGKIKNVLILCDIHAPFHNKQALLSAIKWAKQNFKIDLIILNGDIIDFHKISDFIHNPEYPDCEREVEVTKMILQYIRKEFKKQRIIYVEGNHEVRLQRFVYKNSKAKFAMKSLPEILGFKDLKIEFVNAKRILKFGKLNIMHGHEIPVSGKTPGRNTLLKTHANCLFGHLHRYDEYVEGTIDGPKGGWSVGSLCDLTPEYWPHNNWVNGFAVVQKTDKDGNFQVFNKKIIKGKVI